MNKKLLAGLALVLALVAFMALRPYQPKHKAGECLTFDIKSPMDGKPVKSAMLIEAIDEKEKKYDILVVIAMIMPVKDKVDCKELDQILEQSNMEHISCDTGEPVKAAH